MIKGKQGEIITIVSLKTYIIIAVIIGLLYLGYFYFITHKGLFQNFQKVECPAEIIPERIDCNLNGNSCSFYLSEKQYWADEVELKWSFGSEFHKGYREGENVNYLYPDHKEKDYLLKYERENIGKDGVVYEGIKYGIYLVLDSRDKTSKGYKIIESKCFPFKDKNNYIPKNLNNSVSTGEGTMELDEENKKLTENIDENSNNLGQTNIQIQKTPEEELLDFCKIKFKETSSYTEFKNSYYFEDYSKASTWLDNKYPNEGLTINIARFFKEWYLDKAEFPIYIIEGSRKIDQNVIEENGKYACDKTGILKSTNWNYEK